MKYSIQDILGALSGLQEPDYDVHTIDDAWYMRGAEVVRIGLEDGMLELHPIGEDEIAIMCYCCFDGEPQRGIVRLDNLKEAIVALKDHHCAPWPG